jgi:hypothetical protein
MDLALPLGAFSTHRAGIMYYYSSNSSRGAKVFVGQAFSLRRVFNPPSDLSAIAARGNARLLPCSHVGQVVNLRPIVNRPGKLATSRGIRLLLAASYGFRPWRRLALRKAG